MSPQVSPQPILSADEGSGRMAQILAAAAARGLAEPDPASAARRLLLWWPLALVALVTAWTAPTTWVLAAAIVAVAFFDTQFSLLAHSASHGAAGRAGAARRLVGHLSMTLFAGVAFEDWTRRHLAHHRHTQVPTADPDMESRNLFSLTPEAAGRKRGVWRLALKLQGVLLWPVYSLLFGHKLRIESQVRVLRAPHRHRRDALVLLAHHALRWGVPLLILGVSPARAALVYFVPATLGGVRMAMCFWTNHIGMQQLPDAHGYSFLEHQVRTSRNVVAGPLTRWFYGGLNYQIEHHLVPVCPYHRLGELRELVAPIARASRLPYTERRWLAAAIDVTRHVHGLARVPPTADP